MKKEEWEGKNENSDVNLEIYMAIFVRPFLLFLLQLGTEFSVFTSGGPIQWLQGMVDWMSDIATSGCYEEVCC